MSTDRPTPDADSSSASGTRTQADLAAPPRGALTLSLSGLTPEPLTPEVPQVAGYTIARVLGQGGMGVVYEAVQKSLNRRVALKMLLSGRYSTPERLTRFMVEGEMLARLHHANIVQIHEVGQREGVPFLALEYVDGPTLAECVAGGPLEPRQAAAVVERLARAVQHAHANGVVHRDLKPANVLMQRVGAAETGAGTACTVGAEAFIPKVTDFGLAKSATDSSGMTETGAILGTPSYMSPEQAEGSRQVGPAADIYSLGAVLYQLLTGRPPFKGETPAATVRQVLHDAPAAPRSLAPTLPRDLEVIGLKCLEKEPTRRYASADALADDLRRFLEDRPISARPVGRGERLGRWARRNPAVASLSALLVAALCTGVAGIAWKWREADHQRAQAVAAAEQLQTALEQSEANYRLATDAVEKYLTGVNLSEELQNPAQAKLRQRLLGTAREFYAQIAAERAGDPAARAKLAEANHRLGQIAWLADKDATTALSYATRSADEYRQLGYDRATAAAPRRAYLHAATLAAVTRFHAGDVEAGQQTWGELATAWGELAQATADTGDLEQHGYECDLLGRELMRLSRTAAALPQFRAAVAARRACRERLPDDASARNKLAQNLRLLGNAHRLLDDRPAARAALDESQREYVALIAAAPNYLTPLTGLGHTHYIWGLLARRDPKDHDEALRQFSAAAERYSAALDRTTDDDIRIDLARAYVYQAELRLERKQYDLCYGLVRQAFLKSVAAEIVAPGVSVLLACAEGVGNAATANTYRDYAGRALAACRSTPAGALAKNNLAWYYATFPLPAFRDAARAVELAQAAVAAAPKNGDYQGTLGAALYLAGDFPAARTALTVAAALPGGGGAVNGFFQAMTHAGLREPARARELFDRTAAAKPDAGTEIEFARLRDEASAVLQAGGPATARIDYQTAWGMTQAEYDVWVKGLSVGDRFTPLLVHAHETPVGSRLVGLTCSGRRPSSWSIRTDAGVDAFQQRYAEMSGKSFRLVSLCGYTEGGTARYKSVWSNVAPGNVMTRHNCDQTFAQKEFSRLHDTGARVFSLSAYRLGSEPRLTMIYTSDQGRDSDLRLGLNVEVYETALADYRRKGWRPAAASAARLGEQVRFEVAGWHDPDTEWVEKHGLTAVEIAAESARQLAAGFRPESAAGYFDGTTSRYLGVWIKPRSAGPPPRPPATGQAVTELAGLDVAMQTYMAERAIPAGALAVVKNGQLVFSRGYGQLDRDKTKPVPPDTPFRIASLTKPLTAAAVRRLIADGKLKEDAKVAPLLGLVAAADSRWQEITVGQLLTHRAGFDRGQAGDPMFQSAEIVTALKLAGPPTATDVLRYMTDRPLQFDPDAKTAYSNFGYCVLGRVIEKVSGRPYLDYLREEVLAPVGARGVTLGRTLPDQRDPREPFYSDPARGRDVMHAQPAGPVPAPDGGFHLEAMDAHGGLIASAPDLARFLGHYQIDGRPAGPNAKGGTHFGSLPGTFTVMTRRADGVCFAALFNQRADASGLEYDSILKKLNEAADAVTAWPAAGR